MEILFTHILQKISAGFDIFFHFKTNFMNCETIMNSDVLDIIFEKRNKLYGAYVLRRSYNTRLLKAFAIMMGLVAILCAFSFVDFKTATIYNVSSDYFLGNIHPGTTHPALPKYLKKKRFAGITSVKSSGNPVIVNKDSKQIIQSLDSSFRDADLYGKIYQFADQGTSTQIPFTLVSGKKVFWRVTAHFSHLLNGGFSLSSKPRWFKYQP